MSSQKVIEELNIILGNELIAINQYFLHSKMLADQGYPALAEHSKAESIDEMKHADTLTERILFLNGLPNLQKLGKLTIGEQPKEMFEADLALERHAIKALIHAIEICEKEQDYVSRNLLSNILSSEEEHAEWLETQLRLIEKLGLENYLQTKI